jgi:hypothetical protein
MLLAMTGRAECDQVLFLVTSHMASKREVLNLKIPHTSN